MRTPTGYFASTFPKVLTCPDGPPETLKQSRTRFHEPTIAYVARRTAEGKSKRDIIRCLKRYVIREVYHLIKAKPTAHEIAA